MMLPLNILGKRASHFATFQSGRLTVCVFSSWHATPLRLGRRNIVRASASTQSRRPNCTLGFAGGGSISTFQVPVQICYMCNSYFIPTLTPLTFDDVVSRRWLCRTMRQICRESGVDLSEFKAKNGWCSGFLKWWKITRQRRSNRHTLSLIERLPLIRNFHRWLIYGLQRSGLQRDPKYGRFPPEMMFHFDQVPLAFVPHRAATYNARGKQCKIKDPYGSDEKRFCTLQVCICAAADKQIIPLEIFSGGPASRFLMRNWPFTTACPT